MLPKKDLINTINLINRCLETNTKQELNSLHSTLQSDLGIDFLLVGHSDINLKNYNYYFYGISDEWQTIYRERQYITLDPIVKAALSSNSPILWQHAYANAGNECLEFIQHSRDFQLSDGISFIKTNQSLISSVNAVSAGSKNRSLDKVQSIILQQILPHIAEIPARNTLSSPPNLTSKELEVLKWCAVGKSYWELGTILGVSERTVKFHMKNIFSKLDVLNKAQAVARAMSYGIISL
ncbi:LuxR C-terminal-related transcriptional regulator [Bacterioplanoides sp.]|uniref:helix-turn-helix transcriptional regulator n=1 Tax=Bacterioplanoides sp. TaxID=2066072 RepID=UPI003B5BD686